MSASACRSASMAVPDAVQSSVLAMTHTCCQAGWHSLDLVCPASPSSPADVRFSSSPPLRSTSGCSGAPLMLPYSRPPRKASVFEPMRRADHTTLRTRDEAMLPSSTPRPSW